MKTKLLLALMDKMIELMEERERLFGNSQDTNEIEHRIKSVANEIAKRSQEDETIKNIQNIFIT